MEMKHLHPTSSAQAWLIQPKSPDSQFPLSMSSALLQLMPPSFYKSIFKTQFGGQIHSHFQDWKWIHLIEKFSIYCSFFFFKKPMLSRAIINCFLPFIRQLITVCIFTNRTVRSLGWQGSSLMFLVRFRIVVVITALHLPRLIQSGRAFIFSNALGLFALFFLSFFLATVSLLWLILLFSLYIC